MPLVEDEIELMLANEKVRSRKLDGLSRTLLMEKILLREQRDELLEACKNAVLIAGSIAEQLERAIKSAEEGS